MKPLAVLRDYLSQNFPKEIHNQSTCTCGRSNHVRVCFVRVEGLPAVMVIPETSPVSLEQIRAALATENVKLLLDAELDTIFADTELGQMQPFENPFGGSVYLDASLLPARELVFCPRMFFGQEGHECFRVQLEDFLKLTRAQVVPLTVAQAFAEDWVV